MHTAKWLGRIPLLTRVCMAQDRPVSEPVIRTSTRLVEVSVIVPDKHGAVADLAKDAFILTDRGKPREISVFSVQSSDVGPRTSKCFAAEHVLEQQRRRSIKRNGSPARRREHAFRRPGFRETAFDQLLKTVDPRDRIALYTLGKSLRVLRDFDHPEKLRQILAGRVSSATTDFTTAAPEPSNTGSDILDVFLNQSNQVLANAVNRDRASITINAFLSIADHLAQIPGPKNVVWVTGGLPFSIAGAERALNRANIGLYPVDARGLVGLPAQLTASGPGFGRTIKPGSISLNPAGLETLKQLADLTGGKAFYDTNDISGAIRTAVEDTAATYTLGFYPDSDSLDGKFHQLKVQLKRPGLEVRSRRGYYAVKNSPATERVNLDNPPTALWSPLESSTIALEAEFTVRTRPN